MLEYSRGDATVTPVLDALNVSDDRNTHCGPANVDVSSANVKFNPRRANRATPCGQYLPSSATARSTAARLIWLHGTGGFACGKAPATLSCCAMRSADMSLQLMSLADWYVGPKSS